MRLCVYPSGTLLGTRIEQWAKQTPFSLEASIPGKRQGWPSTLVCLGLSCLNTEGPRSQKTSQPQAVGHPSKYRCQTNMEPKIYQMVISVMRKIRHDKDERVMWKVLLQFYTGLSDIMTFDDGRVQALQKAGEENTQKWIKMMLGK